MSEPAPDPPPQAPGTLDQAMASIRAYCGWHIAPSRTEVLTLDGSGANVLVLPSLYVTDVIYVNENGTELADGSDEAYPAEYTWSRAGFIKRGQFCGWPGYGYLGPWWTDALRGITVKLQHGYDDWPVELAGIIQSVATRLVDNPQGLKQQTVGPFSEQYGDAAGGSAGTAFLAGDEAVLARYKLPPRP